MMLMTAGSTSTPTTMFTIMRIPSRMPISAWKRSGEKYQKKTPALIMVAVKKTARPEVTMPPCTAFSRSLLFLVDLDNPAHDIKTVVNPEADSEGDHGEGVDVETDILEDHVGKGQEVGQDEGHGKDDPGQDGPVGERTVDEDDGKDEDEDRIVPGRDDLVGRGQNASEPACRFCLGVLHELRIVLYESPHPTDHFLEESAFMVLQVELYIAAVEVGVIQGSSSRATCPWCRAEPGPGCPSARRGLSPFWGHCRGQAY